MRARYAWKMYYPELNKLHTGFTTRLVLGMLSEREILPGKDS